jgi:heme A synthase
MLVVSAIIGALILGVMVYLALSKKSRYWIRVAALIALGVMILSVIVCLIAILSGRAAVVGNQFIADMPLPVEPPRSAGNLLAYVIMIIFLLTLFIVVLILSIQEQRKGNSKTRVES